jgi:Cu(I)/Ag(I) efflux system membrane fusion protein/cobalt-zinc-cadmium efflux system membrane fusion protein
MKTSGVKMMLVVLALGLATGLGYLLGLNRHEHQAPTAGGSEAAAVQYTCSMHPFIIRDAPGSCPICGMALTPVKSGEGGSSEEGIRIDPVTLQNMGVRTEKVARRSLQRTIRTNGLVAIADDRQYAVTTKIEGWVDRLHVNQMGQPVKTGQPLLEIYSPDLVAAQQEYLLAVANRRRLANSPYPEIAAGADRMVEASRTRLRYWDIGEEQIRSLERTGQVRKTLVLTSEHGGIVTEKKVLAGARVMAGEELLQIADLSTVWINADLYEYDIPWVKVGQPVQVELPLAAGTVIDGRIAYIYPVLESETRTLKARIEVPNPGLELKPAMYAQVSIMAGASGESLVVPTNAVLNSGKGQTVFVAKGEGRFVPRSVTSGLRDDQGFVQILSGLSEGEAVVVSAQFMLDSESRLREALDKMTSPAPHADHGTPGQPDAKALDDLFK